MSNKGLKNLFNQYSSGIISTEEYRIRRTQIIDEITGEITVRNNEFSPPTNPQFQARDVEADTVATKVKPLPKSVIAGIAFVFIIVIVAVSIFSNTTTEPHNNNISKSDNTTDSQSNEQDSSHNNVQQLVQNFIDIDQWQISDIDKFMHQWKNISNEGRGYAYTTSWFRNLRDTVSRRIVEQRALADIGDNNAAELEKRLQILNDELKPRKD